MVSTPSGLLAVLAAAVAAVAPWSEEEAAAVELPSPRCAAFLRGVLPRGVLPRGVNRPDRKPESGAAPSAMAAPPLREALAPRGCSCPCPGACGAWDSESGCGGREPSFPNFSGAIGGACGDRSVRLARGGESSPRPAEFELGPARALSDGSELVASLSLNAGRR